LLPRGLSHRDHRIRNACGSAGEGLTKSEYWAAAGLAILALTAVASWPAEAGGRVLSRSDVVTIRVLGAADLDTAARVAPDGTIAFPFVGRIKAAGRTEDELARAVERRLVALKIVTDP
jgi:protein involved in polysaccharide export with SLBB domain